MPDKIVSDRDPQFASRFWRELCHLLRIELNLSSAYHPETNGLVERANQTLVTYLRHFVSAKQDDWASLLSWAEFALNNAVADSTGQTPFLLNYGQHPRVPVPMPVSSADSRVADWAVEARDIWDSTQDAIWASKERMRSSADAHRRPAPTFAPGDLVWLSTRNIRLRVESTKFAPRYLGPFKVLEQVNHVVYRLALPPRLGITDTFHVSLLKPVYMSWFSESSAGTSGSSTDDYEVNAILGYKVILKEFNKVEVDTGSTGAECKLKKNDIFTKEIEASIVFPENDDAVLHVFETQGLENTLKSDTDKTQERISATPVNPTIRAGIKLKQAHRQCATETKTKHLSLLKLAASRRSQKVIQHFTRNIDNWQGLKSPAKLNTPVSLAISRYTCPILQSRHNYITIYNHRKPKSRIHNSTPPLEEGSPNPHQSPQADQDEPDE
ncbi:unnamed protein product, partial [Ranitomeya imitator]